MLKKFLILSSLFFCLQITNAADIKWLDEKYDDVIFFNENTFGVKKNSDIGIIDENGSFIVRSGDYASLDTYSNLIYVMKNNYLYNPDEKDSLPVVQGIYNYNKKLVIPFKYEVLQVLQEGFIGFYKDGKWGFLNSEGNEVIPNQYDLVNGFSGSQAIVVKNSKYGVIDKFNNIVLDFKYDYISKENSDIYLVKLNNKYGYINEKGEKITDIVYDEARNFDYDTAVVGKINNFKLSYGIINKKGEFIVTPKYNEIYNFKFGYATVGLEKNYKKLYGKIDKFGNEIVECQYDEISDISENYFVVKQNNKWGYKKLNTKDIPEIIYDRAYEFKDGLGLVCLDKKWFYVNDKLEKAFEKTYDKAYSFKNGYAIAMEGEKYFVIDKNANEVSSKYDSLDTVNSITYIVKENNKFGVYDVKNSKMILPVKYDYVKLSSKYTILKENDKFGIVKNEDYENELNRNNTAYLSNHKMSLNGSDVEVQAYLIDGNNYFMLRDLASKMTSTSKNFDVSWDSLSNTIKIYTGRNYTPVLYKFLIQDNQKAIYSSIPIFIDDEEKKMTSYNINGNTYYKLRDLGNALGFSVDFDQVNSKIIINTEK